MVGVNIGAGQIARARKIAWTSSVVGLAITGSIGVVVAIMPLLWLHLFSHDPEVLGLGTTPIQYKGETYWVCCSGCAEAFRENPEKYIAEFKARKAGKK